MAIFSRLLTRSTYSSSSPNLRELFGSSRTVSGADVNTKSALTLAAVWAAVRVISEAVASLPLITYRRLPAGGKERAFDHPLYSVLHDEPNPHMTSMVFRETLQAHILTHGNAYAEIQRVGGGRVAALWPIMPDQCQPDLDEAGGLFYKVRDPHNGQEVPVDASDILHIPGLGWDGLKGYSPIRMARENLGLGMAAEQFGAGFFGNSARPSGILTHPGRPDDKAIGASKTSWQESLSGARKAGKVATLWGGIQWTPMSLPPEEAQYIETRKFSVTDVARWFNIPPHMLRDLERATFANIEQQSIDFVVYTLRSWIIKWEQEVTRKLLLPEERGKIFIEHLVDGLLRGDSVSRSTALKGQIQCGYLTIDEAREIENRNPLPGGAGKQAIVMANMIPLDMLGKVKPGATATAPSEDGDIAAGDALPTEPAATEPAADAPATDTADAAASGDVQGTALNGAQIASLLAIADKMATGILSPEAAKALIKASFPLMDDATIDSIVNNIQVQPPAAPIPTPAAPPEAKP